ncbi:MAG TPA: hypothetical protein VLF41_00485 [Candidatus Nanoarchaeia archaeon]|nr:hypothetical protein [Candidatus Nanoarchaeia archaeon]
MARNNVLRLKYWLVKALVGAIVLSSLFNLLLPASAQGAQINDRKLTLSTSKQNATGVTYTFVFTIPSTNVLKSFKADICDAPTGACTAPTGFTGASATNVQPVGLGDASGWTTTDSTAGALRLNKTTNAAAPANTTQGVTVTFSSVHNPNTTNTTFYARLATFTAADYATGPVDSGVIAVSTANQITINAYVPETLTLCVYQAASGSPACPSNVTSTTVDLGTLSISSAKTGTSIVECSSNANGGYAITYSGDTLKQGARSIAAIGGTATTSSPGTEQFGFNAVANTSPSVGADPTGTAPIGRAIAPHATANNFAFDTASLTTPIAFADSGSTPGPTNKTTWTLSWLANIQGVTAAGNYTTTVTFVATATF